MGERGWGIDAEYTADCKTEARDPQLDVITQSVKSYSCVCVPVFTGYF